MWLNWLPWRYIVRRVARARGFVDPISVLSHLHRFAQPAEVAAPMELLRAGVVFHARGLMNTGAIQHNLDWVWPYWVERQFDPKDDAFIPRAFSITHVNLTHRNWTAVGLPDYDALPIVDPRGLLTPFWDGWSLDGWIVAADGRKLLGSQMARVAQHLDWSVPEEFAVVTSASLDSMSLDGRVMVVPNGGIKDGESPACVQRLTAWSESGGWLVVALRPYNPEGVSFVHDVSLDAEGRRWTIDGAQSIEFSAPADRQRMSSYRAGDVFSRLSEGDDSRQIACDVGMCTAAAMFEIKPGEPREITLRIPLADDSAEPLAATAGRNA